MEEKTSNSILLGIVGAIIGAFIGAIPWILVYIFANLIVALLSILIAVASYYGYKITKARIDKKLPVIVVISSVFAVTVSTFVIIPLILMAREGIDVSFDNLKLIYEFDQFRNGILRDYAISLIFTVLGISGIISTLHKQIKDGVNPEDIKLNLSNGQQLVTPEETQEIKEVFVKNNALSKYDTISKEDVIADLGTKITEIRANQVFEILKAQRIIKKSNGNYYFSEKAENKRASAGKRALIIVIVATAIIVGIGIIVGLASDSDNSSNKSSTKNNSSNSISTDNTKSSSNNDNENLNEEVYESDHIITGTDLKFVPKDELIILTKKEIETYFESEYTAYEIIAMNMGGTRELYCFIDNGSDLENATPRDYLEKSFSEDKRSEITSVTIAGVEFQTTKLSFEDNENKYTEDCYVAKVNGKFICFDYCYPEGEDSNFETMIVKK